MYINQFRQDKRRAGAYNIICIKGENNRVLITEYEIKEM